MKILAKAHGYAHNFYAVELTFEEAATKTEQEIITACDNNSLDFSDMTVHHFGGYVELVPGSCTTLGHSQRASVKVYID